MRLKEEKVDSDQQADKMEIINIYNKFRSCGSVTTDSRTLKGGEMFFALKGENFDGNLFAEKALENARTSPYPTEFAISVISIFVSTNNFLARFIL